MPVSTFSSGNSAVRRGSRGEMIARWNSTRERISQDERRIDGNEISEVDGTDLHERADWPLAAKKTTPVSPENSDWKEGDHHITRVDHDWVVERDVSDIEDEEDETTKRHSHATAVRNSHSHDDHDAESLNNEVDQEYLTEEPIVRSSLERGVHITAGSISEVSPLRADFAHSETGRSASTASEESRGAPSPATRSINEEPATHDSAGRTNIHLNGSYLNAEEASEQQDMTPPMPSGLFQGAQDSPQRSPLGSQNHRSNGSIDTNIQHARQSSIAKNGLPGYHSRQSSYNKHNTTQIPHNKDRVRYSWQSIQEDDSNNRPRIHIIKLVSNTTSASSAFPQGEAFGFSISPSGRRIAAYDSSRLYILQTAALPVGISQDFSLKRRPLAVELNDSGSLVAILADSHTINVYDLSHSKLRRTKTFKLDFPANCIAVAPCGGLLAAAYEGGVEVFALAESALLTDRRAVRSPRMDCLAFSEDGSTLLGTTTRIHASWTVVINVPVFPSAPNNIPTPDELKLAWCSELLHPENIRNSSHAAFMRENRSTCNERVFAWDGNNDTFGILNTGDMEYGNIDFPVVISPPLSTCGGLGAAIHSCPAIDEFGDTVAMIVNDRTIRLYVVPHKVHDDDVAIEAHSIDHELDEGYGSPFNELRWVHSHSALPAPVDNQRHVKGRLIVTSPGGVYGQEQAEESFEEIEGGRIILLDFDAQFAGQPGQTFVLNLGKSPPQPLEEEEYDVADAIALVRKRTVKQNKAGDMNQRPTSLGRAATTANANRNSMRPISMAVDSRRTASIMSIASLQSEATRSLPDLVEGVETVEAIEEPFSNTAPRSQASLQRAASNVQRHRFQALEERNQERVSVDSNGNFLALPEYTEEPNAPLPSRFRAMAGLDVPAGAAPLATRPAVLANRSSYAGANAVPMSAPPAIAESFSAEQAFAVANAAIASRQPQNGSPSMPRGLLRAYSNAANAGVQQLSPQSSMSNLPGAYPPSPVVREESTQNFSTRFMPRNSRLTEDDAQESYTGYSRGYDHRFSTPLASLVEHHTNMPRRSSSSRRPGEPVLGSPRSFDYLALRQGATTASLFPQTQSSDHVPLPTNRRSQAIGGVAHPVTAWHPPAPSIMGQPLPGSSNGHMRGHSRKSSLANKSAFASTAKAKKLGFFKRRSKPRDGDDEMSVMDDGKSMATWRTVSDRKCVVM